MNHDQPRHQAGTPTGGQWAATAKAGPVGVTLTDEKPERPLAERLAAQQAKLDRQIGELRKQRDQVARGCLAAAVVELEPEARTLVWEIQDLPAYHSDEEPGRRMFLEKLLDSDGRQIDLDGDHHDWVNDSLEEYDAAVGVPPGREGTTGSIDLEDALQPFQVDGYLATPAQRNSRT